MKDLAKARTFREDDPHLQVAGGQSDDGGFVQLGGDGGGQRQQFGQLIKLAVLLLPTRPRRVLRLLLHAPLRTAVSLPSAGHFSRSHTLLTHFSTVLRVFLP